MAIKNPATKKAVNKELDDFFESVDQGFADEDMLLKAVNDFVKQVKKNLENNDLVASGRLYQSIKSLPFVKRDNITTIRIEAEDYYKDVEEGTKPKGFTKENRKQLQPKILEWIGNKPSLQSIAGDKKKQRSLSYAIATNILKNGTIKRFGYRGKRFITDEIPYLEEKLTKGFEDKWQ